MGNCQGKWKRSPVDLAPSVVFRGAPVVHVYGPESSPTTSCIRIALLYKTAVVLKFVPSDATDAPVLLQCGAETVSGTYETLLRYIDEKFPEPPLLAEWREAIPAVAVAARLQHKSVTWHLERLAKWAEDLAARKKTRGEGKAVDPAKGSPRMEVKKFERSYSQLLQVMLEHAQMEERIVFPVLEKADRGICTVANEEHARDLPIMNGIKEDIKSIGVLEPCSPAFQEAMLTLSARLKTLLDNCKEHFEEEERELLPLLEAAELSKEKQEGVLGQCLEVMEVTHSSDLFLFLMGGLLPQEAMQYLDMVSRCSDRQRVSALLRVLMSEMERSSRTTDPRKGEFK
ncbi:hypothetical protein ACLOJK_020683 [Asimina triloba]